MRSHLIRQARRLKGEISLLGDKSIAHRSVIISALSQGVTRIENFPPNKDCLFTINALRRLGIKITAGYLKHKTQPVITVFGEGLSGLKKPRGPIFVGDSGTTLRLLLGALAGCDFSATLTAGGSLSKRPMRRITQPLRMMGARINSKCKIKNAEIIEEYPSITIRGGGLRPISYKLPVASAQVKSAILLAGLYAQGRTQVIEPIGTRDHTERMLKLFKADIKLQENKIVIKGNKELVSPGSIYVPGDLSSASFFLVLAAILPNSEMLIKNVSLNPSRMGIIRVLKRMGADIKIQNPQIQNFEPMGNILVKSSTLRGITVKKEEIPSLIDELPVLMVAASVAEGKTVFRGIQELRVKETDRIKSMSKNLNKMGVEIRILKAAKSEDMIIKGAKELVGTKVRGFGDHRTAISMIVAGLKARGQTLIDDVTCINKSFPNFLNLLKPLLR